MQPQAEKSPTLKDTPKMTKEAYLIAKRVIENIAPALELDENDIRRIMTSRDGGWNIRALVEATAVAALEAREGETLTRLRAKVEAEGKRVGGDGWAKPGMKVDDVFGEHYAYAPYSRGYLQAIKFILAEIDATQTTEGVNTPTSLPKRTSV